jgi:hypothetical protein
MGLYPLHTSAQLVEVNAWLDSTKIQIGQQVKLYLTVNKDSGVITAIGELRDSLKGKTELLGNPLTNSSRAGGREILSYIFNLTSFEPGMQEIPAIPVFIKYKDINDTLYSKPLFLEVYSPVVDTTLGIKDIKALVNTPITFREALPYIGIGTGTLLVAAFIYYLYKRFRKKKPLYVSPEKLLPAHVIAFRELDKLKDEKLWQSGKVKEYYVRLADIIRIYLENRFEITAMEYVTEETLKYFKKVNREDDVRIMLEELLYTADMVKFAKQDPLPSENQSNMNNAYLFIEKTKYEEIKSVEELVNENAAVVSNETKMIE